MKNLDENIKTVKKRNYESALCYLHVCVHVSVYLDMMYMHNLIGSNSCKSWLLSFSSSHCSLHAVAAAVEL